MSEDKISAKIRGIYSTAISKLLLDNKVRLVEPTQTIKKRFSLPDSSEITHNLSVYDSEESEGINIQGEKAEFLVNILKENLPDIIIRKKEMGAIYLAEVKDMQGEDVILNLGNGIEGILFKSYLRKGSKLLVQVKGKLKGKFVLSTSLRLFGENLVLIEGGFTKVSESITDEKEKSRLISLANKVKPKKYGILWKSQARIKNNEELEAEINILLEKEKKMREKIIGDYEPHLLDKGEVFYTLNLGYEAKNILDSIRNSVVPTVSNHHLFKSIGKSELVDFAEYMASNGRDLNKDLNNFILKMPEPNQIFTIVHKKSFGGDILMKGKIEKIDKDTIILKRDIYPGGVYDGLEVPKEEGDYSLTFLKKGALFVVHKYFNKEGKEKGSYININTGVELMQRYASYIDLEIDVVKKDGESKIIDENLLEELKKEGMITDKLFEKALSTANRIKEGDINVE